MTPVASRGRYAVLRQMVNRRLEAVALRKNPRDVREALQYVVSSGGKRVRSVLLLLSCQAVGGKVADAIDAAAAVELLHNFTLVHDDIMDNAPTRRGKPTVHTRWGLSNGVLAGDILLAHAYESVLITKRGDLHRLLSLFTQTLLDVCEGQGVDLFLERRRNVGVREYFTMIERKTAALFSACARMGGIIGSGTSRQVDALGRFGHYLGRAFQIQDDLLDVVAEERALGKLIGGDIVEGKKTFLLLKAIEKAKPGDRAALKREIARGQTRLNPRGKSERIRMVTALYKRIGVIDEAERQIQAETQRATAALSSLPRNEGTSMLRWVSDMLLKRAF